LSKKILTPERWVRLFAEGAAIMISILLAFTIDAWWQEHKEDDDRRDQLQSLAHEFAANRMELHSWIELHRQTADHATKFIDELGQVPVGDTADVSAESLAIVLVTPTFDPSMGSLDTLIASGQLAVIKNDELRFELASWPGRLTDAAEDEQAAFAYVETRLIPVLEQQIPLADVFDYRINRGFAENAPTSDTVKIEHSLPLDNILARRRQHTDMSVRELERAAERLDTILTLLEAEIGQ